MRFLITGGAGFVGSSLARHLKQVFTSATVVTFDNLRRRGSELNLNTFRDTNIDFVHGDIRSRSDLADLNGPFDVVVDCSAEPSVHAGWAGSPDYVVDTNLVGTFNCLNLAREHKARFILLSSSRVYSIQPLRHINIQETETRFEFAERQTLPGVTTSGVAEEFPTHLPRSFYGASKLASEQLVQEFVYAYGLNAAIFRCGVIAGPGQFGKADQGVFTMWVAHHYFRRPLRYTGFGGSGRQVRDLLHVADLCDLVESTVKLDVPFGGDVFNIGGGKERSTSLAELTRLCRDVVGHIVPIASVADTADVDVPIYVSDSRKFFLRSAWRPARSVETIVLDTLQWIRANESTLQRIFV
jgi:CDP-paratose 2-epimerase